MSSDKFAESRRSKVKQILREAEASFAKASLLIGKKDILGNKFKEILQLLEEAYNKYKHAVQLSPIAPIQIQYLICLLQWSSILLNQGEELLQLAQKKTDKFSRANRQNASKYISDAINKYEDILDTIESMKDCDSDTSNNYSMSNDDMNTINQYQYSTLLEIGKAQSLKGVSLLTEADLIKNDKEQSKLRLSEALFLFKQSYNNFADVIANNPENHIALRYWGSTLCKEANTLMFLNQTSPDPKKIIMEGGEKLILSYKLYPSNLETRNELASFFYEQGSLLLSESQKNKEIDKQMLSNADCLFQFALKFSHPQPSRHLLQAYSTLTLIASKYILTPTLLEHIKLVSEEYKILSDWVTGKKYQNLLPNLRKFSFLTKKGKVVSSWKRRFFILTHKQFHYYAKPDGKHLGSINLNDIRSIEEDFTNKDLCFAIDTSNRRFLIQTDDESQLYEWMKELEAAKNGKPSPLINI